MFCVSFSGTTVMGRSMTVIGMLLVTTVKIMVMTMKTLAKQLMKRVVLVAGDHLKRVNRQIPPHHPLQCLRRSLLSPALIALWIGKLIDLSMLHRVVIDLSLPNLYFESSFANHV